MAAGGFGCSPQAGPERVEDTLTSGRITIVCPPELMGLMRREQAAFDSLYPQARITLREGGSSEAVRALFAAECDLAVTDRELEPVERGAAIRGGLELEGYRFARDGVALVVHPSNPVENAALDEIRGIFQGAIDQWTELGGERRTIRRVIAPPASDVMAYFVGKVMNGAPIEAQVAYESSDSGVVADVARHPEAIGIVTMAWAERGVKPLRLANLKGLAYRRPDAEGVHGGEYPLWREMHLYTRPGGPSLANGFITYVTSREGQALVRDAGLVPIAVPVRFVRRSPMMGSHR
jgi:phosphate transport system substrate-binding protein